MRSSATSDEKAGWRKVVWWACISYCLVAWVVPIVLMAIFDELPYMQTHGFLVRLLASAIGSGVLLIVVAVCFPSRFRIYGRPEVAGTGKVWILAGAGLLMFTAFAAVWSGNLFGALVKLAPAEPVSDDYRIVEIEHIGASKRKTQLTLRKPNGEEAQLALSHRLFDVPPLKVGDGFSIIGRQNVFGIYVESFQVKR